MILEPGGKLSVTKVERCKPTTLDIESAAKCFPNHALCLGEGIFMALWASLWRPPESNRLRFLPTLLRSRPTESQFRRT